jgi:hypothetical protein
MSRVLTVLALTVLALAPASRQSPSDGLIVGRVVDGVTGQPVASAGVRMTRGQAPVVTLLTGVDGQFAATLPAGEYDIRVYRHGYFEGAFGRKRQEGSTLPLTLSDGERRGDVDITIWPTASVSGQVFDDVLRPLPSVTVAATRVPPGGVAEEPTSTAVTDDTGAYRIDGLPPGRYLVSVRAGSTSAAVPPDSDPVAPGVVQYPRGRGDPTVVVAADGGRFVSISGPVRDASIRPSSVFVTTWYGGATLASQATPIDLAAGDDRTAVDITMASRPAGRIAGRLIGLVAGEQAVVRLFPPDTDVVILDDESPAVAMAVADADGLFAIAGVAPGPYLLDAVGVPLAIRVVVSPTGIPSLSGTNRLGGWKSWARRMVVVGEAEADAQVVLTAREHVTVAGTVTTVGTFPTGAGAPRVRLGNIAAAADGGRFEFTDVRPGWYRIDAPQAPAGWSLRSVRIGGRETVGLPFEVGSDGITDVTVTFGPQPELSGDVTDAGRPADDATVALFPTDRAAWRVTKLGNARVTTVRTTDGTFAFQGVPPGEYFLTAVDDAVMGDWPAPEFLDRLAAGAARVILTSGVVLTERLQLDRSIR